MIITSTVLGCNRGVEIAKLLGVGDMIDELGCEYTVEGIIASESVANRDAGMASSTLLKRRVFELPEPNAHTSPSDLQNRVRNV